MCVAAGSTAMLRMTFLTVNGTQTRGWFTQLFANKGQWHQMAELLVCVHFTVTLQHYPYPNSDHVTKCNGLLSLLQLLQRECFSLAAMTSVTPVNYLDIVPLTVSVSHCEDVMLLVQPAQERGICETIQFHLFPADNTVRIQYQKNVGTLVLKA